MLSNPPPVESERDPEMATEARMAPDPRAHAAPAGVRQPEAPESGEVGIPSLNLGRKKARSLFARMTGATRGELGSGAEAAHPANQRAAAVARPVAPAPAPVPAYEQRAVPRQAASAPAQPAPAPASPPASPQVTSQPRLTALDPTERLGGGTEEDELLDIPAFLRRQAN